MTEEEFESAICEADQRGYNLGRISGLHDAINVAANYIMERAQLAFSHQDDELANQLRKLATDVKALYKA